MPNSAELEKIQKDYLSDEQIEKDKIREDAHEAGSGEKEEIKNLKKVLEKYIGNINEYGSPYIQMKDGKSINYYRIVGFEDDNVVIDKGLSYEDIKSSDCYGLNGRGFVIYKDGSHADKQVKKEDMPCKTIRIPLKKIEGLFFSGAM